MVSRILSTLVLWGIILGGLWLFHTHAAVAILTLLSVLTLHEFYVLLAKMGYRPFHRMGLFIGAAMTAAPYYIAYYTEDSRVDGVAAGLLVLAVIVACVRVLGERDPSNRAETIGATALGLLFVPFLLHFLVRILMRDADSGENLALCLWVIAVSKFCDVGALLTGLAIGRHKMAPLISPKKTWEGAVGGVLTSAGVGAAIAWLAGSNLPGQLTPALAALLAVPLALTSIVSDLIESAFKRRADLKDTGRLIPGIGGAFDLTDSLLLTAPVAYFLFLFLD